MAEKDECDFANVEGQMPPASPIPEQKEENRMAFLPPEHPLLQKFQQSLREFLLRTKEQLLLANAEISHQVRLKEQQRDAEGSKLYEMQSELENQNTEILQLDNEIQQYLDQRREKEHVVALLKTEFDTISSESKEQKMLYKTRMVELQHMQTLEINIHKWVNEVEDEVKNSKCIVNRDAQLQKQLSEEKKKSDMLFYHMDIEVKKREQELDLFTDDMREMTAIREVLNTSISFANADLESLQSEHKRLTKAWNEVILAISYRDKILFQVNQAIEKEKECIKMNSSNIEAIKKQIAKELDLNEKLEIFKSRLANDFISLKRQCQHESETLAKLEGKLEKLPLFLEQTEKDLNEARKEGNHLEIDIRRIQFRIDKQYNKKFLIEEGILKWAQEQLIADKASAYRLKLLSTAQERRRGMELTLAQSENQLSETLLEMERLKGNLFKLRQDKEQLNAKLYSVESRSDHLNMEMKATATQIDLKLKRMEKLSRQLDEAVKTTEGSEASPIELKIRLLEKALHEAELQIREHQKFWLQLQNHYVNLSQKRNNQLNEIQVTRKQLAIIMQKSLRIDHDLERSETTMRDLNREIQLFTSKVEMLNERIFKKRKQHEVEETDCELEHSELLQRLKDSEMMVLGLEAEIDELYNDIEHCKDLVLDKHREALSWETKYKLIDETIRWRKDERTLDSEIGIMKKEIHRMQIRFYQLRRAQEKLVQDLEHCIMHREQIFITASTQHAIETKSDRSKGPPTSQQKISDIRTRLKQVRGEINSLTDKQLIEAREEHGQLLKEIRKVQTELEQETKQESVLRQEIENGMLQKHANLEKIIRKQNRAKSYRKLNAAAPPMKLSRSETTLEALSQKQMEINDNLLDVVQLLSTEFPEKKIFFTKLTQILKD